MKDYSEVEKDFQLAKFFDDEMEEELKEYLDSIGFPELFKHTRNEKINVNALISLELNDLLVIFDYIPKGIIIRFHREIQENRELNEQSINVQIEQKYQNIVQKILASSEDGKVLKLKFESKEITNKERRNLCSIISRFYLEKNTCLSKKELGEIAGDISDTFPDETAALYVDVKLGKGMLYDKYNNNLKELRKKNVLPSSHRKRKLKDPLELNTDK